MAFDITLYALKPRFQTALRPLVACLDEHRVAANQVTIAATAASVGLGALLFLWPLPSLFLILPIWLLLRLALNAVDGMLAREFGQESRLGAYLNEIGDVIADAALYLPFGLVPPFSLAAVGGVIFLSTLSEFVGVLGQAIDGKRRYDGPLGKSDRALVFGTLALWLGMGGALPTWAVWIMPAVAALAAWTTARRILPPSIARSNFSSHSGDVDARLP